jgi:hypothetical protein
VATHRRTVLKRGISLLGTAAAAAAAGTTAVAAGNGHHDRPDSPDAPRAGTTLVLHGVAWRVTSRDLKRGELPPEGVRMLTRGEIVDAPAKGRKVGDFYATYYRLSAPGKVPHSAPGSLELHTFVFADGTIVGSGIGSAAPHSEGQFAIVGGTGRYLGVTGAYAARQGHAELGGDGTAVFTFTFA